MILSIFARFYRALGATRRNGFIMPCRPAVDDGRTSQVEYPKQADFVNAQVVKDRAAPKGFFT
jgi:hypothetical protein